MKNNTKQSTTLTPIEGKILKENSTHVAVHRKTTKTIEIYTKGFVIPADENDPDDKEMIIQPNRIDTILLRDVDDLFAIFEQYDENNRINLAEANDAMTFISPAPRPLIYLQNRDGSNVQMWNDNFDQLKNHNWNNFKQDDFVFADGLNSIGRAEFNLFDTGANRVYLFRDATPDWNFRKPFTVGQSLITPSNRLKFIGHDKNGSACVFFALKDADGDPVNIDDVCESVADAINTQSDKFREILSTISMNLQTVNAVEKEIQTYNSKIAKSFVWSMIDGNRGHKYGQLFFTYLNNGK